ncbi:MAG: cytochrome c peroxidase [Saprospiraceae bacterium]|nr:cytochrome c peroxidase [Saprospiraceae bacterium]
MKRLFYILPGFCLFLLACQKEENSSFADYMGLKIPSGFPLPEIPTDNILSFEKVSLGRRLFYDPIMSRDSSRSCASCHAPHLAFSDSIAVSFGVENRSGTRNSVSLANVVYQKKLLREGGVPTLEMQILVPIQEHNEFDFNILEVAERMKSIPEYTEASLSIFGRLPDAFVITRSIAAFQRTLISGDSPFDQWFFQGNSKAVSESVKRGFSLFNSQKLNCSVCHSGFLLTNQSFVNNGLYEVYKDSGRIQLTGLEVDRGVFKVPSLRNIALTKPYMHDGSLSTLESVIEHYQSGGKDHPNRSAFIKPFSLTESEKQDLISFLVSLTDHNFVNNPMFHKP